jgi:hypothetical protein
MRLGPHSDKAVYQALAYMPLTYYLTVALAKTQETQWRTILT